MKLPNCEKAYIPPEKLSGYLMSDSHLVGRIKAKLFRSLGFNQANPGELAQRLLALAKTEDVQEVLSSSYGTKYVI